MVCVKYDHELTILRHLNCASDGCACITWGEFSSVQDGINALGKAHMRSTPSLRSFPVLP